MVLPPCIDQQLISIYVRLEQLQWSLLTQQRRVGRLVEQQKKKIEEQEKLINFLTHKLAAREQALVISQVDELEKCAMSRLPKLVEEREPEEKKEWEGDEDSAIHLNSTFDSLNSSSSSSVERPLQRSVSDVVARKRNESETSESFPSNLYRGFLLRHQKKQRGVSLGAAPSSTSLQLTTTPAVEKLEKAEMYQRSVKQAHKTTIFINSGRSRKNPEIQL